MITLKTSLVLLLTGIAFNLARGETNSNAPATLPSPTFKNVSYGPHPRNILDFWQAKSDRPTPLLLFVHGGGWRGGDKTNLPPATLEFMLAHHISVAAIDYRYSDQARLPAPVHDAARALQFLRSRAEAWNISKARVAAMGGSAGACTSLWLAYHDDLAVASSPDPVTRESTRLCAAVGVSGQTSIDPKVVVPWVGDQIMNHGMMWVSVGATNKAEALRRYDDYRELYREFSPINHVTSDDPPVLLYYCTPTPLPATNAGIAIHHAILGQKLKEKADALGLVCELQYAGLANEDDPVVSEFLLKYLTAEDSAPGNRKWRDVFIFGGQSNMAGNDAVIPDPPGFVSTDADRRTLYAGAPLPAGSDSTNDYCPWGPVKGHHVGSRPPEVKNLGPEAGFARRLAEAGITNIAIVAAWANYPRTVVTWPWGENGDLNTAWLKFVDARFAELRERGFEPRVRGFVWHQGIDDAIQGKLATHHQENVTALIAFLRRRFHAEEAPFVLARSVNSSLVRRIGGSAWMAAVRQAQVAVGETVTNSAWINVDDLPNVAEHHFSADSQLIIGRRFGDAYLAIAARTGQVSP